MAADFDDPPLIPTRSSRCSSAPQMLSKPKNDALPVRDNQRPVVVVLGNGRSVLDDTLGPAIDACDVVVRCNDAPIAGYERHVGTRTDILIFCDSRPDEQYVAETARPEVELVMYLVHRNISSVDPRLRSRCEYVPYSAARALAARHRLHKRPTTGLIAVWYCLERFVDANICLHGFDYVVGKADDVATHYWRREKAEQFHTVHAIRPEAKLLRKWIQLGIVSLLHDFLRERGGVIGPYHEPSQAVDFHVS